MPPTRDLVGHKFGQLTVVARSQKDKAGAWLWLCQCTCGAEVLRSSGNLQRKRPQSCGCGRIPAMIKGLGRENHGATGTREHKIWMSVIYRCAKGNYQNKQYLDKGITVCQRWQDSFSAFLDDMGPIPDECDSIDRIDNTKGYSPDNCRWADRFIQSNNRCTNVQVTHRGETLTIAQWARRYGHARHTVWRRLKQGKSLQEAVQPTRRPIELTVNDITKTLTNWGKVLGLSKASAFRLHREGKLEQRLTEFFEGKVERKRDCAA